MYPTGKNALYLQAGGPTSVINASACGVIEAVRKYQKKHPQKIGKLFAANNSIVGILHEELIDTHDLTREELMLLRHTPASAFGSCRFILRNWETDPAPYERLVEVFKAHDIGTLFYNGGNDSQDAANRIEQFSRMRDYPMTCIGIPKTIDNDLLYTDNCPGFGSAAKYVATSIREATLDLKCVSMGSTRAFILEVMGRNAGWIAAASGLAHEQPSDGPHIILFSEIPFDESAFIHRAKECIHTYGYVSVVVSEGLKNKEGKFFSERAQPDGIGHTQLGGVAPIIADLIKSCLGYKYHWAVSDYLQRAARHIASKVDVEQAYALGWSAVEAALAGKNNVMMTVERLNTKKYQWKIGEVELAKVASAEKKVPREFITPDGFHITDACRRYLAPLIQGEDYPPYENGLPKYFRPNFTLVEKKLPKTNLGSQDK